MDGNQRERGELKYTLNLHKRKTIVRSQFSQELSLVQLEEQIAIPGRLASGTELSQISQRMKKKILVVDDQYFNI